MFQIYLYPGARRLRVCARIEVVPAGSRARFRGYPRVMKVCSMLTAHLFCRGWNAQRCVSSRAARRSTASRQRQVPTHRVLPGMRALRGRSRTTGTAACSARCNGAGGAVIPKTGWYLPRRVRSSTGRSKGAASCSHLRPNPVRSAGAVAQSMRSHLRSYNIMHLIPCVLFR